MTTRTLTERVTIASGLSRHRLRRASVWSAWLRYGPVALIAGGAGFYMRALLTFAQMKGWL
jgi:hypothetical protein